MVNAVTTTVVVATRSSGKLSELRALLSDRSTEVLSLDEAGVSAHSGEEGVEIYETFEENAQAKARYYASLLPGMLVIADDSGLEVEALNGAPGVRSKRWSGREDISGRELDLHNNRLLLETLERAGKTESHDRGARYVCCAASSRRSNTGYELEYVVRGECRGEILASAHGEQGFGYDPLFWSHELQRSFGESSKEEKGLVSHRGRALRQLIELIFAVPG